MLAKPILAVDLDDTIAQFLSHLLDLYNEKYGYTLTRDDIRSWNISKYIQQDVNIWDFLDDEHFYDDVVPIDGAIDALQELSENFNIFIVTSTGGYVPSIIGKVRWLQKHLPFISRRNWVFCGDKDIIKAEYMIDDGPHNLKAFNMGNIGDGIPILFDAPHNQDCDSYARVYNWQEAQELLYNLYY